MEAEANPLQVLSDDTRRLISSIITFLNNKDMEITPNTNTKGEN